MSLDVSERRAGNQFLDPSGDPFKKIVIVKDDILLRRNDEGIVTMGIREFLMNPDSLAM